MMVGSAFLGLNIVAVGIVRNVSIIMLAKLSNTINGKYASSMKLLLRTLCFSLGSFFECPIPDLNSAPTFKQTACVRLQFHKLRPSLAARAPELSVPPHFIAG